MIHRSLYIHLICILLSVCTLTACGDDEDDLGDLTPSTNNQTTGSTTADTSTGGTSTTGTTGTTTGSTTPTNGPVPVTGKFADTRSKEINQQLQLPGLRYPVYISFDEYGIPHILGESIEDIMIAQGYIHARDRLAQMDLFRRVTGGSLAEVAGSVDPGSVRDDIFQRVLGFNRVAQEVYDSLPEGDVSKRVLDSYTAGVNLYIEKVKNFEERLLPEVQILVSPSNLKPWTPLDSLALVRLQQYQLSFDVFTEINRTRGRLRAQETFPADSEDPALAKRAGLYTDLVRHAPADRTYMIPDFGQSKAKDSSPSRPDLDPAKAWRAPRMKVLTDAIESLKGYPSSAFAKAIHIPKGLSNSWVVSGSMTDTGNAMLANDPHLSLDSPALFHQIHLVNEPRTADDGPELNAFGAIFPGLPGILIGHNENVAWGLTTASYDYTDAFVEELVWEDGAEWPKVRHNGELVELEIYEEVIEVSGSDPITVQIPVVPHHGPLVPVFDGNTLLKPEGDQAISMAWRGFGPSNEVKALLGFMTASNIDDINTALEDWIIGTQNLVFATTDGDIYKTGKSFIPLRKPEAMTWDPVSNPDGVAPWWTLSGTGEHDWIGSLDKEDVPNVLNPSVGYIATANNDQTGTTDDNNPLNDYAYIGYDYDLGFRAGRIERLLRNETGEWPEGHKFSLEDLGRIQTDTYSNLGERVTPYFLAVLDKILEEYETPGTHADLQEIVEGRASRRALAQSVRDLLGSWNFEAENGMWGTPSDDDRRAASATSAFNFWMSRALTLTLNDERSRVGGLGESSQQRVKALLFILENPQGSATLDADTGESVLWDNIDTGDVYETRDHTLASAFFAALDDLEGYFESDDPTSWMWGQTHTRIFSSIIPALAGTSPFTWPRPDEGYPNGFPRSGDNYNVDACNGGYGDTNYRCGGGAILRWVIDMGPDGITSYNAVPGGQVWDYNSPWFRNELEFWLNDERHIQNFQPGQVDASHGSSLVLEP